MGCCPPNPFSGDFNSRPSARGDGKAGGRGRPKKDFNSRPSARGDSVRGLIFCAPPYFNSRPSARGDATRSEPDMSQARISIHAPPRGATAPAADEELQALNFNSRPSARGDRRAAAAHHRQRNFNSRPSARGDHSRAQPGERRKFQFTPLREGRRDD